MSCVTLFVQRKAAIEAKNEAETMIYSAERSVSEYKDKVPQTVVDAINAAIGDVRGALESQSAEEIKAKSNALQQAIMKIGESMSQQGGKAIVVVGSACVYQTGLQVLACSRQAHCMTFYATLSQQQTVIDNADEHKPRGCGFV